MVAKRDYKMISIFEVFAVNRNEDDFLENLFIFKDLVHEEQNELEKKSSPEVIEREEEEKFPVLKIIS
jgi:hypothetical protein